MRKLSVVFIVFLSMLTVSCGDGGPKVAKVEGTVNVDGKPLAMGKIMMSSEIGRQTVGDVVDGQIKNVTTLSDNDGAVVGTNRVAIRPSVDESIMMKNPLKAAQEINAAGIPKKYHSLSTTELTFEIKYGQTNNLEIDITTDE